MRKTSIIAVLSVLIIESAAVAGTRVSDVVGIGRPARPAPRSAEKTVPAPLFRDPVYDGAADPSLIWNDTERAWWIFYTNRRANDPQAQDGVRWCHGTDIGIASSADGGQTWVYRGTAKGLEFEPGRNTFWAPCLLEHGRVFHMFAAYVRGVPADWSGDRHIVHYTSRDLVNWKFEGIIPLSSERAIDAFVYAKPSGGWRMWYKDEANGSHLYAADSEDLFHWTVKGPVVSGRAQEGPAVFWWQGSYWLLADRWEGMVVLRSHDLEHWTEQPGTILGVPGSRPDDGDIGRHGEVIVQGGRAFLVYFTHPAGKTEHIEPGKHRSSLQAAELRVVDGSLVCDRDKPFSWSLGPPGGFRPAVRLESALRLETSDPKLSAAFAWAKGQALDYAFPQAATGDAVGDWYEAALPGRFAFCMRDVSHQAAGAQALGLARFNVNMFRKFAEALSPSRDFCSYWEIDKYDRPAPVDYKNDRDFWYNLPANFDVLDACWRMFLWTGDRTYVDDPAFRNFYERTVTDYVRTWDRDGDGIPDHRLKDGNRGIGSYDEGDMADRTAAGADLLAAMRRSFLSYAEMLKFQSVDKSASGTDNTGPERGHAVRGATTVKGLEAEASRLRNLFRDRWWDPKSGRFAGLMLQGGQLADYGSYWQGLFALYAGLIEPGPARHKTVGDLAARTAANIEMETYFPEVFYRYGEDKAAYAEILKLSDPAKPRREYPEVSYAVVGAIAAGLFGIDPDARERVVATRPRLTEETAWAELDGVPVFGNVIKVRHNGNEGSVFENISGPEVTWKAVFPGRHAKLSVDGKPVEAASGKDEAGRVISWVLVKVGTSERKTAGVQ